MKSYFIVRFDNEGKYHSVFLYINTKELLEGISELRGEKIAIYEAECIIDWS